MTDAPSLGRERPRIAVFFALGTLGTVPGLQDALLMLTENGYAVDVFVRGEARFPDPEFGDAPVSVYADRPGIFGRGPTTQPGWMRGRGGRPYSWIVRRTYHPAWRSLVFRRELSARHRHAPYHCIIALDSQALVDSAGYAVDLGVPVVFWSLELIFWSQIRSASALRLKEREVRCSRDAALVIVQDPWRGAALVAENGLDPARVVYVPNAPRGSARRRRSSFLHETLGLDPARRVVLCAGAIEPWAMSLDLVRAASRWPSGFTLVLQSRSDVRSAASAYVRTVLGEASPDHVAVLTEPLSPSDFRALVDSADVGLALYDPRRGDPAGDLDRNIELMGYASGKIASYLQGGLPIIVNSLPGPRDLIARHGCGRCADSPEDVAVALADIFADYERYTRDACQCFDQQLELERHFAPVVGRIMALR